MWLMGVEVWLVEVGIGIFKDVILEVICDWVINVEIIYYILGFVVGFYFYLMMVCDFYVVIGVEICV